MNLIALAARATANASNVVPTIDTGRLTNITNSWGGNSSNVTSTIDFGTTILQAFSVYPDSVGVTAWVLLFSLPFVMMWIAHSDMVPAAGIGFFLGLYIFQFSGSQYAFVGVVFMVIAAASIVWSMWQKRG